MSSPETPDIPDNPVIPEMSALFEGLKGDKGDKGDPGPKGDKGDKGNKGVVSQSKLAEAAEAEVTRLIKAKTVPKWWGRALAGLCALLLVLVGIGIWNVHRIDNLANSNAHGAYTSCIAGNKARATNVFIWDSFITLILKPDTHPDDAAHQAGAAFEKLIAQNEKPQDCTALYPSQAPVPTTAITVARG
jgi:hypothetical protein